MADKVCYSNNGHSMHWVPEGYKPGKGEKLFSDPQTPEQLSNVFAGYADTKNKYAAAAQIGSLEAQVTPRRLREAVTSPAGKAWLADIESQIDSLRGKL